MLANVEAGSIEVFGEVRLKANESSLFYIFRAYTNLAKSVFADRENFKQT